MEKSVSAINCTLNKCKLTTDLLGSENEHSLQLDHGGILIRNVKFLPQYSILIGFWLGRDVPI